MRKKLVIIVFSSIILAAMVAAVAIGLIRSKEKTNTNEFDELSVTNKAVMSICQPTDYKEACLRSLASVESTEPKEIIKQALKAAKEKMSFALQNSTKLEKFQNDSRTSQAFQTCDEALDLAMDNIQESYDTVNRTVEWNKIGAHVNDLQSWLSSSFSYSTMCLDSFEDNSTATIEAKKEISEIIESSRELTNNALVMINQFEKKNTSKLSRYLLAGGNDGSFVPNWLSDRKKRLISLSSDKINADAIVAKDGSGEFKTISEALNQVPNRNDGKTYVIYVKAGVYEEYVTIGKNMNHIMIIGDGPTKTRIVGNRNYVDGFGTFKTGTFRAFGAGFIAKDIGFENTAGPSKHQAVALHVGGDMSVIYNCQIDGYQDTLLAAANRQFYKNCTISGTIDFIYGYGSAVFQDCRMLIRKPMENQLCMVTANGRDNAHLKSGIIIENSVITAAPDMVPFKNEFKSYLGRPWKALSRTIIMNSVIDDLITPDGWSPWAGNMNIDTCFYGEFNNTGPGADLSKRVPWAKKLSAEEANKYSVSEFISGENWIPLAGVHFLD